MRPELFKLAGEGFPAYFVLLVTGFVLATYVQAATAKRHGLDPDTMVGLGISMLLWGVVGSRLLHVVADGYFWDYVHLCTDPAKVDWHIAKSECLSDRYDGFWDYATGVCHPKTGDCFAWAKFWAGGLTYYGGFLGAAAAAVFILRRDKFSFWRAADIAATTIPLGLAFGRMGCLLAGCCFGAECELPWAMSFPPHSPASEAQFRAGSLADARYWSHAVHPTQIYESLASLAVAAVCILYVAPRKRYDGQVFAAFLALYAVARCLVEILRRDDRGGLLGLSTSQAIGVGLVIAAAAIHRYRTKGATP
jgi:phosphatidylglycerol:prolipoprotein diacylglycerol transferase